MYVCMYVMCTERILIYTCDNSIRNILFGTTKIYSESVSYGIVVPTNRKEKGKKKRSRPLHAAACDQFLSRIKICMLVASSYRLQYSNIVQCKLPRDKKSSLSDDKRSSELYFAFDCQDSI